MKIANWPAVTAAAAVLFVASGAVGQTQICDQRKTVLGHLAEKYKEAPIAMGVTSTGSLIEVLTNGDGNTWTIIVSKPDGMSCLVAAGEGWRKIHSDRTGLDPQV
jgi:hypothetical protein